MDSLSENLETSFTGNFPTASSPSSRPSICFFVCLADSASGFEVKADNSIRFSSVASSSSNNEDRFSFICKLELFGLTS